MVFAAVLLLNFASTPPLYRYWGENLGRLTTYRIGELGRAIGDYIWVGFFPAVMGFLLVILTLILGLSALLRGD